MDRKRDTTGKKPVAFMPVNKIWFNRSFSSLYNIIGLIRQGDAGKRFRLVCSHTNPDFVGFAAADEYYIEPADLNDDAYVKYCLDFCLTNEVNLFFPTWRASLLNRHAHLFNDRGTRLHTVCPPEIMPILENKGKFYDYCRDYSEMLPEYRIVTTRSQFDEAYDDLRRRHALLCFKPAVSIYGRGFRIIREERREIDRLLGGEQFKIGLEHARMIFAEQDTFDEVMVMQYLEGEELSVDCLADHGKLLRHVIRCKPAAGGGVQFIEENRIISAEVERLTTLLSLNGLYNIQFRESRGVFHLLEINPRMSGGLHFTILSGLNLPYWSMLTALELCNHDHIPFPRSGVRYGKADIAVALP